ncbi:MAG: NfeD family protein [Xanthobacteraceae bacterium]|nr:NfeD family protein [Xanthobacteraceae bacterium]
MIDLLATLGPWSWLVLGLVLMAIEAVAPGAFMMWLGLAAFLVGALAFAFPAQWQMQIVAFALISLAMVPLWRHFARRASRSLDNRFLNRRTKELVGHVTTLATPIVDGIGTIKLGDTVWRVEGPDLPAGTQVKIEHADGARLRVRAA